MVIRKSASVVALAGTNEEGRYRVEALVPGAYQVEMTLDGFESSASRVTVDLSQVAALDVTLAPVGFTEGVVVTARRIEETAQEVPIPLSVVRGSLVDNAGAFNVTTRKPGFTPETTFELSYGDLGVAQAKASVTGPLARKVAGRLSFSGTRRDGNIFNIKTRHAVNDLNNLGLRGQVLAAPSDTVVLLCTSDCTRQRPEGYTQVVAGVAPTLRPADRQYAQVAADLGYTPPSFDAFDRLTDVDTALRSYQDLGGSALNADFTIGPGRLTSTTAWRFWNWNPSNDRDFIGLPVTSISAAPSRQHQFTQEVRYAGDLTPRANFVVGGFAFRQSIDSDPSFKHEQGGSAAARFLLAPTAAAATPGLLDGYGYEQSVRFGNVSAAAFGQVEWSLTDRLRLLPGVRFNYDQKDVDFNQRIYGRLQTTDPALIALQRSILSPQSYVADVDDTNLSGVTLRLNY